MATAAKAVKDATFLWEGMDKRGKKIKGQMQAGGEAVVNSQLRKQGITVTKVKKQSALFSVPSPRSRSRVPCSAAPRKSPTRMSRCSPVNWPP